MKKLLVLCAFAVLLAFAPGAGAVDLSSGATDLTSIGLPGYFGQRVDCDASQISAMTLAVNPVYEPVTVPVTGVPARGRTTTPVPTDPSRYYALVVWVGGDAAPPSGDGQPNWPSTCVKSNAAASTSLIGILDGVPVDGF